MWDGVRDSFPHPYTLADAEAFVTPSPDPTQRGLPNPTKVAVCVKILPADDDHGSQAQQLVGCIGADPGQDVLYRTWELGYWLTPAAWGRGYATEATGALLRWLLGRGLAYIACRPSPSLAIRGAPRCWPGAASCSRAFSERRRRRVVCCRTCTYMLCYGGTSI